MLSRTHLKAEELSRRIIDRIRVSGKTHLRTSEVIEIIRKHAGASVVKQYLSMLKESKVLHIEMGKYSERRRAKCRELI